MTCDFRSFSTVFQSYKDDVMVTIKGCVQWNLVRGWNDFLLKRDSNNNRKLSRPGLTHNATGTPSCVKYTFL